MKKYFGTDGIRGTYESSFLDDRFATQVGRALGIFFQNKFGSAGKVFLARDTRPSGESLLLACAKGLVSTGADCHSADIIPSPALAFGIRKHQARAGIMITASHNPHTDNGIKVFNQFGSKLSPEDEEEIEQIIEGLDTPTCPSVSGLPMLDLRTSYIENILNFFPNQMLGGLKIAVDYANGATCRTTREVFTRLGAKLYNLHTGENPINFNCGSEHPGSLSKEVLSQNCHLGIAHDGDGDRVVLVDQNGLNIDGDQILGVLAIDAKNRNQLKNSAFVSTIHSNSGLRPALNKHGICLHLSDVGDRNVYATMKSIGCNWGGESSGHIIHEEYLPTGDGLFSALSIVSAMINSKKGLRCLADEIALWPSICESFNVQSKPPIEEVKDIQRVLNDEKRFLGENGRVLLRYSGTESKIRLLVEGKQLQKVEASFARLAKIIQITL